MDKLVYIYYPVLAVLFLWGARLEKRGEWNEEFLSLRQTKAIQGFTAILIMFHHISQKTCASWLNPKYIVHGLDLFVNYGYYFVGIFLFGSGYGLYKSYMSKENYLQGFVKKRILPLVVAFYSCGLLFLVVRLLMKQRMQGWDLWLYIIGFKMPNPNSWYVVAVPMFYLAFYLFFRYIKNKNWALILTCLFIFCYTLLGTFIRHNAYWMCGEWWYNSAHLFSIGLLFARWEKEMIPKIKSRYFFWFILGIVFIFVSDAGVRWAESNFSYYYGEYSYKPVPLFSMVWRKWVTLLVQQIASTIFVLWVFVAGMKLRIGNKALDFMGKITLEFYLIHGLFIELFGFSFLDVAPSIFYIRNVALFVLVVFVMALLAAIVFHKWMKLLCGTFLVKCKRSS